MADKNLLQLPVATTPVGALLYGVQDNTDKAFPPSVIMGTSQAQAANYVYAGPPGPPGALPSFRRLVANDIPDLSGSYMPSSGGNLTNATITNPTIVGGTNSGSTITVDDNKFTVRNATDTTKLIRFNAANISPGQTRVYSWPDAAGEVVVSSASQSLTNKTLGLRPSLPTGATLNLPPGAQPSSPNEGDIWTTAGGMYVRIGGETVGPLASEQSGYVTSWNGRVGSVTLTSADVQDALGFLPYNPVADSYVKRAGDNMTGNLTLTNAFVRSRNWNNVATDGIVYLGDGQNFIHKNGTGFKFTNAEGAFTATLDKGGTIWTSVNLTAPAQTGINQDVDFGKGTFRGDVVVSPGTMRVQATATTGNQVFIRQGDTANSMTIDAVAANSTVYAPLNLRGSTARITADRVEVASSNLDMRGAINFFSGAVNTQQVAQRFGWNNNVQRWAWTLEDSSLLSLYRYDSAGTNPVQRVWFSDEQYRELNVVGGVCVRGANGAVVLKNRADQNNNNDWHLYNDGNNTRLYCASRNADLAVFNSNGQLLVSPSSANPATAWDSFGYKTTGINGGGYVMSDGGFLGGWYMDSGSMVWGFGFAGVNSRMRLDSDGNWSISGVATAAGGFGPTSDPRTKDKSTFHSVDNALEKVYNLNVTYGKYHDWFNDDGKERIFLMADEAMKQLAPQVVLKDLTEKDGTKYDGWSADQMIALLVKAVQELKDKVTDLEERLDE